MKLTDKIVEIILNAEGKALATSGKDGIHVVPVSTVKVLENKVVLVDYFMGKTVENLQENTKVSLACWLGLEGFQIKGDVDYLTEGELFTSIKEWAEGMFPDRTVKGVLQITPKEVFDVSATAERPGVKLDLP